MCVVLAPLAPLASLYLHCIYIRQSVAIERPCWEASSVLGIMSNELLS